ncbi:integrator complex subunit 7-like [Convolutriloba macropyga]|uniref:integrator complex subunit 7-like n=1 Tax=Convolutriloba macropyga TaxID=536237 RepID=UPI003F520F2F
MATSERSLGTLSLHQGNLLILSLDKGFRSGTPGDQIDSLVRLPTILNQIPLPVLINSAFLKLADLFRAANNAVRAYIVNVCEKFILQDFAAKIINKSDYLQKIESVMHSNDPVARSLALRQLGVFSSIGREKVSCHHFVKNALDSNDQVEVEAALFAAYQYSLASPMFSAMIISKIQALLDSVTCCPDHIVSLISILGNCGHDLESSSKVVQVVLSYANTFNTTPHLLHIVNTASETAIRNRVMCNEVIDEVLDHLVIHDKRPAVQQTSLACLLKFAQRVPHAWTNEQSNYLLKYTIGQKENDNLFGHCMKVVASLPSSVVFNVTPETTEDAMEVDQNNKKIGVTAKDATEVVKSLMEICEEYCYTKESSSIVAALNFYAKYAEFDDFIPTFEYTVSQLMQSSTENRERLTHECLDVLSQIMESSLSTYNTYHMLCKVLANQIVQNTRSEIISLKSFKELVLWLQCFIGRCRKIYEQSHANEKLTLSLKKNLQELSATLQDVDLKNFPNQLIPNLIAVFCSCYFVNPCENKARAWIETVSLNCPNKWNLYQVARNLLRYGMYAEAKPLLKDIHGECRSSRSLNWIAILLHICDAESIMSDNENRDFDIALESYQCALRVISSYPTKLANQEFQRTFLRLRSEFLDVCSQVQKWVFMGKLFSFDEFDGPQNSATLGPMADSLLLQWRQLKVIASSYEELQRSIIDADLTTRQIICDLQTQCRLLSLSMYALFLPTVMSVIRLPEEHEVTEKGMLEAKVCEMVLKAKSQDAPLRLECLNAIIELILQCSLEMPRFFLQCRRCTSVQLLTSITQNLSGEPTTVFAGENLTFKTEGVVTQKLSKDEHDQDSETVQRLSVKRCRVIYQVKLVQASRSINAKLGLWSYSAPSDICDVVHVDKKGYFFSTVLIKPPIPGKYEVRITLKLIEEASDIEWNHNLVESVLLKAIDKNSR